MTLLGAPVPTPFYRMRAKFHLNVFIVSASGGQKLQFWANFDILGAPVSTPFYRWEPNLVCYSRPAVYGYVPNFVSIGLFCRPLVAKKTNLRFLGLRHLVLSPIGNSLRKLSTGAQLQTFPYSTASKSFLYSNAFMAKSGAQTLTFKRVTDKQTNKQTDKKLNVFGHPGGGWNPSPTKLGMVIEDLEHVLSPLKRFMVWRIVSPLGGAENLGETRPPQIKTPITP